MRLIYLIFLLFTAISNVFADCEYTIAENNCIIDVFCDGKLVQQVNATCMTFSQGTKTSVNIQDCTGTAFRFDVNKMPDYNDATSLISDLYAVQQDCVAGADSEFFQPPTESTSIITRTTETGVGTIFSNSYVSVHINNVGAADGLLVFPGGTPEPLKPNETYSYEAWLNPITNEWMLNEQIDFDATGTEFRIILTAK